MLPTAHTQLTKPPRPSTSPTPQPKDSLESWIIPVVTNFTGPDQGSHFGTSVALSLTGKVLAVGAPEHLAGRGEVRVYHASAAEHEQWILVAILTSRSGLNERFGFDVAVSLDGSILAVGAPGGNGTIYTYDMAGEGQYALIHQIESSDTGASIGYSVALSDDGFHLVAGAPLHESTRRDFEWTSAGVCAQREALGAAR
ncbi:hypothetical protein ACA910_017581 [Epithemia clementina (nom. ined.)]